MQLSPLALMFRTGYDLHIAYDFELGSVWSSNCRFPLVENPLPELLPSRIANCDAI